MRIGVHFFPRVDAFLPLDSSTSFWGHLINRAFFNSENFMSSGLFANFTMFTFPNKRAFGCRRTPQSLSVVGSSVSNKVDHNHLMKKSFGEIKSPSPQLTTSLANNSAWSWRRVAHKLAPRCYITHLFVNRTFCWVANQMDNNLINGPSHGDDPQVAMTWSAKPLGGWW